MSYTLPQGAGNRFRNSEEKRARKNEQLILSTDKMSSLYYTRTIL
jgi:hypothetical protein